MAASGRSNLRFCIQYPGNTVVLPPLIANTVVTLAGDGEWTLLAGELFVPDAASEQGE